MWVEMGVENVLLHTVLSGSDLTQLITLEMCVPIFHSALTLKNRQEIREKKQRGTFFPNHLGLK